MNTIPVFKISHKMQFGLKTGIGFAHFAGIEYGIRGNYGSVRTYFLSFQFQTGVRNKEKCANSKWIHYCSNLSNDAYTFNFLEARSKDGCKK